MRNLELEARHTVPPNTHCYKVSRCSIRLPGYGLHKNSLGNQSKGLNSKSNEGGAIIFISGSPPQHNTHCYKISSRHSIW